MTTPLARIARFERDLVVQAGAGTGKTHALVTLYLHLVAGLTGAKRRTVPARIAVVTFTDKAAGELRERLRERLLRLIEYPNTDREETLAAAAAELGVPLPEAALWADALAELPVAPVGTFHSFAGGLVRRHAARLGLDPDFVLLDEPGANARATEAAEGAVLDALERGDGDVAALVAEYNFYGVGHGRGLVDELVRVRAMCAEEGRPPDRLDRHYAPQAIEDDWQAAVRSFTRALARLGEMAPSLGGKSAPNAAEIATRAPDFTRREEALADVREILGFVNKKVRPTANPQFNQLKAELKEAGGDLERADASRLAQPLAQAFAELLKVCQSRYAEGKRRAGVADFTDLLVFARDLLRDHADVRNQTRARFDAVLVDEFQDTNPVQAELVDLVAGPTAPKGGRRFVVGDRKQSIYEFRGADVGVFTRAAGRLFLEGADEALLQVSHRSAPSVIALNNELFARVMQPKRAGAAWELSFDPERDRLHPLRAEPPIAGAELLTVSGDSAAENRSREARAIAVRIRQLVAAGRRFNEVAVLLRRFTHLVDYLDALRAAQVPYFVVRGRGFFEAQEVRDLASALTLLDDPDDRLALVAVLRSPLTGVSDETLAHLALDKRLRTTTLLAEEFVPVGLSPEEGARLDRFRTLFRELRLTADRLGPAACLRALVDGTDLAIVLLTTREGEQRVANLERLIERARAFEAAGGDLRGFVAWLRRAQAGSEGDVAKAQIVAERDDVVRVMTIHQAKGLEFPIVFVPACGAVERRDNTPILYHSDVGLGLKIEHPDAPGPRVQTRGSNEVLKLRDARQRAESLRLFYVAATRAGDLVVFSGEPQRGAPDSWRAHIDSLLASETGSLLRVVEGASLTLPPAPPAKTPAPPFDPHAAERAALAAPPAIRPRALTTAVTQLADFEACPRRYQQFHVLGLAEHPSARPAAEASGGDEELLGLDPLRRGTLAHRLLERCDFAARGRDLDALLAAEGYSPADDDVREVRDHAAAFLATPFARRLANATIRRELPFLLGIPLAKEATLYVRGQIDLLVLEAEGLTVVDYKHARAGDPDDYRLQLDAYALAARRLYPQAPAVRVGLAFLKEPDPTPRLTAAVAPDACERELASLGEMLLAARGAEVWPGREVGVCRRLRCGYVYRCHPEST